MDKTQTQGKKPLLIGGSPRMKQGGLLLRRDQPLLSKSVPALTPRRGSGHLVTQAYEESYHSASMVPGPLPSSQFAWDITSCRLPLHARWPFWGLNPPARFSANGSVPPSEGRAGSWRAGSPAHSFLGPRGPAHSRHSGDDCKWVLTGLREHEGSPGRRREGTVILSRARGQAFASLFPGP